MTTARPDATLPPVETGMTGGLAWARFDAVDGTAAGGVVILHGAGSLKENHFEFARVCAAAGLAALAFDARGQGASGGPLDGRAIDDVATMAGLLRERAGIEAIGLRGSSMGGYLALVAAQAAGAAAVAAVCPASSALLLGAVQERRFDFPLDVVAVRSLLEAHDERSAAAALTVPLLLLHAAGDEVVPVAVSHALHAAAPGSHLVVSPNGDHRSLQHDPAVHAETARWLLDALGRRA